MSDHDPGSCSDRFCALCDYRSDLPTVYRSLGVGEGHFLPDYIPVVPVLVVCDECNGATVVADDRKIPRALSYTMPCPTCMPLDNGQPSGVRLVYRDQD
jgi:hypothetical protein